MIKIIQFQKIKHISSIKFLFILILFFYLGSLIIIKKKMNKLILTKDTMEKYFNEAILNNNKDKKHSGDSEMCYISPSNNKIKIIHIIITRFMINFWHIFYIFLFMFYN